MVHLQQQAAAGRVHPDLLAEVTRTWAAIREAAQQWKAHRVAVDGTSERVLAEIPPRSNEIDTSGAAGLLGVTPRRVRQLMCSGDLLGRKLGQTWLVDRASVDLRREYERGHV